MDVSVELISISYTYTEMNSSKQFHAPYYQLLWSHLILKLDVFQTALLQYNLGILQMQFYHTILLLKKIPTTNALEGREGKGRLIILSGLRGMLISSGGSYFHQGRTPRSIWPPCSWWWTPEMWPLFAPSSFLAPTSAVCNHQSSCTSNEVHTVCSASPDWLKIKLHCYSSSDIVERLKSFCWNNDDITCWNCMTAGI